MSVRFPNLSLVIISELRLRVPFIAIISQGYLSIQSPLSLPFCLQRAPTFNLMPPKKSASRFPVKKSKNHLSPTDSVAAAKAVLKPRRVIPSQSSSSSLPSFFDFVEPPPPDDDAEPTFEVGHFTSICAYENTLLDRLQNRFYRQMIIQIYFWLPPCLTSLLYLMIPKVRMMS